MYMAVGHKPFTEIILGKKSLRKRNKSTRKLGPSQLGAARTSCARSRFGLGPPSPARLGSAPGRASSARLRPARHDFGRVWLSSLNLPRLRLGPVRLALDRVSPGLAWLPKWWHCANKRRLSQNHGVTGAKNNQIYGGEKIPQNDWADPGSARIGPAPLQLRSARASRARLGSAWLTPAWACLTRPGLARLGFGTVWLGSARLGCSPPRQPIFFGQPTEETG